MTILMWGCRKDNSPAGMRLVAERIQGGTKAMVDGADITWVAGETLRINGENKIVAIDGDGAYIDGVTPSDEYRFIYPSSINSTATLDGDVVTVTIPALHEYNSDANGKQLLDVPMAGRAGSGSSSLYLKHLTAAIVVEITNYYGFAVLVDSIVVRSGDAGTAYQLSGATTINLSAADMGLTANASPEDAQRKVKMTFGSDRHALKIGQGATKRVLIPVLPVGDGNKFTVAVTVHKDGDVAVAKTYSKTQGTGGAMGRAKLGYAGHTVGFLFSVGSTKKVIISQGNLQYQASSQTWQFASNQYGYVGDAAGNNTSVDDRESQSAWIDLFGWGTSGWDNGNRFCEPYNAGYNSVSSTMGYGYGPTDGSNYTYSLTGTTYSESDWGVHNSISNGGNVSGQWRTLTAGLGSEVDTLFSKRSTSTSNMPAGTNDNQARYVKAIVGVTKGIILFPDNYIHPEGIEVHGSHSRVYNVTNNTAYFDGFNINTKNWAKMEAAGAVFLPAAGHRENGVIVIDAGTVLWYWSATSNGYANAYAIKFLDDASSSLLSGTKRYYGCSVRLVMDVK